MTGHADDLRDRAQEYLDTARLAAEAGLRASAFENARLACELACKARMEEAGIGYAPEHNPIRRLVAHDLVPDGVDAAQLGRLLQSYILGRYGFDEPISDAMVEQAIQFAEAALAR